MSSRAKKNKEKFNLKAMANDVWPIERDVFFRPGRMKYVRKIIKPKGCVFCIAAQNKISVKTLCLYKTHYTQVLINKFPYNNGHLLVMPLRHTGDILDLTHEEYHDIQNVIRLAFQALKEIYKPNGFNLGLNHGATGGAGIPDHLHYHIVPRWNGDLNFFPLIAETKLVIETVDSTYKKLKPFFDKISKIEKNKLIKNKLIKNKNKNKNKKK